MSDKAVRQAAREMLTLVEKEMNGDSGAREEFKQNMNFLAVCGPSLGKSWPKVAEQMERESKTNDSLPKVILTKEGDVPVGITVKRTEAMQAQASFLERLNPFRLPGTTHYLDRQSTGAMLQPLSEDSKEACRIMDPQRKRNPFPSMAPRG
jgi:hypothetical protein